MAATLADRHKTRAIEQSMEITARLREARLALDDVISNAVALHDSIPRLEVIAVSQIAENLTGAIDAS